MLTEQERSERRGGLGGSDIAAALGVAPWKTPLQLWREKTGQAPEADLSGNTLVQWGARLERLILDAWADATGQNWREYHRATNKLGAPFLPPHIDGKVEGKRELIEAKAPHGRSLEAWQDGPPLHVYLQVQQYMAGLDYERAHVAALFGGHDLRLHVVERDPGVIEYLTRGGRAFWRHVESGEPPPARDANELIALAVERRGVEIVQANDELSELIDLYRRASAVKSMASVAATDARAAIEDRIQGAGLVVDAAGDRILNATEVARTAFDWEAMERDHPGARKQYRKQAGTYRRLYPAKDEELQAYVQRFKQKHEYGSGSQTGAKPFNTGYSAIAGAYAREFCRLALSDYRATPACESDP